MADNLTLNISISECMIIGSRHNFGKINVDAKIKIGGQSMKKV